MLAGDAGTAISGTVLSGGGTSVAEAHASANSNSVVVSESIEIVFVDSEVEQSDELIALVQRGAEIHMIDKASHAIDQMTTAIQSHRRVRAVHILSHGESGCIRLGGKDIDARALSDHQKQLDSWRGSLLPDADVLIYGCNTAAGEQGESYIRRFARLTGADVVASTNATGNQNDSDWILERSTGKIDASLFASHRALESIAITLPIRVRAAGSEGDEQMQLQIDGVTVQTWNNIGGDEAIGQFNTFSYDGASGVSADQVRIVFRNDLWDPSQGIDRNLRVDWIEIEGERFETEDPAVFSTGAYINGSLISGFNETETLQANGYFQFSNSASNSGSLISIFAAGNENDEIMQLQLDGNLEKQWNNIGGSQYGNTFVQYDYTADRTVSIDEIRIAFVNDLYLNNGEVDRNLRVDKIILDGVTYQTESPTTFVSGTWQNGALRSGFLQADTLHSNGYFQFDDDGNSTGDAGFLSLATSNITVEEDAGQATVDVVRTQGSDGQVRVDYTTVADTATAGQDFTVSTGTLTFADGEVVKTITVPIIDDSLTESTERFNITIDNVGGGASLLVPRTATVTIVDDEVPLPNYQDFASVAGLNLTGSARQLGSGLELTADKTTSRGAAFFTTPIALEDDASFQSSFSFELGGGTDGADGLTFTVQSDPRGASAIGGFGGELGYDGITNSIAVEFDTYQNGSFDVNNNHVSIVQGSVFSARRTAISSLDLNDGSRVYAWVDYNGTSHVLAAYLSDSSVKPSQALLKATVDLETVVGDAGYVGFTAATGGLSNQHLLRNWSLNQLVPPLDPPVGTGDTVVDVDVVTGLNQPTAIDWLPSGGMLIAEKRGVVRTAVNGNVNTTPFIDISAMVNGTRDRGLLDIAVHPDFVNNPYVYLLFTYDPPEVFHQAAGTLAGPDGKGNRAGRLIRVTADVADDYETAVAGSEVVLLGTNSTWDNFNGFANSTNNFNEPPAGENPDGTYLRDFINSDSESHSVGGLAFAPDGSLFVSTGDGASYNQVDVRADRVQDIDSLSGKVLRIDPITGQGLSGNPFYNGDSNANRSKVYQLGLRNPFRLAVDDATGQLFVGDVGWSRWEEINSAPAGANFGWPFYEGRNDGQLEPQTGYLDTPEGIAWQQRNENITPAIYALSHQADGINAIIMGDSYSGSLYGDQYAGDIFFNDLGQGVVRHASLNPDGTVADVGVFTTGANVVVAISEGPDGALYYVDLDDSKIGRWELV